MGTLSVVTSLKLTAPPSRSELSLAPANLALLAPLTELKFVVDPLRKRIAPGYMLTSASAKNVSDGTI